MKVEFRCLYGLVVPVYSMWLWLQEMKTVLELAPETWILLRKGLASLAGSLHNTDPIISNQRVSSSRRLVLYPCQSAKLPRMKFENCFSRQQAK
jgi:hypothetical protein